MSHSCSTCHKQFQRKSQLNAHQRWHTGDLFECKFITSDGTQCGMKFDANFKLTKHSKSHIKVHCYTCNGNYTQRTFANHKCGIKPGPKSISNKFSTVSIENIKSEIAKRDKNAPYPLNSRQIKEIIDAEANKENINNVWNVSNAKNNRHKNIKAVKHISKDLGYAMRSNKDRRRHFSDITDRQIVCRSNSDAEVFPHMSSKEIRVMQQTFVIKTKRKKKKKKSAKRDIDCSERVMTLKQRNEIRENLQKKPKKKKKRKKKKKSKYSICGICLEEKPKGEGQREDGRWQCFSCIDQKAICCDECNNTKTRKDGQFDENNEYFHCFECLAPQPNADQSNNKQEMSDTGNDTNQKQSECMNGSDAMLNNAIHDSDGSENEEMREGSLTVNNTNDRNKNIFYSIKGYKISIDTLDRFVRNGITSFGDCDANKILNEFIAHYGGITDIIQQRIIDKLGCILEEQFANEDLFEQKRKQLGYALTQEDDY